MGQTRGSNSTGQGSLAASSPNPRCPSHPDSGKGISGQARTPVPLPAAWRACSAPFAGEGGGEAVGGRRGTAGKFRDAAKAPGPRLPALWASGLRPRAQWAAGPSALALAREVRARARGQRGAQVRPGSRGRPRPLTCAAEGSCRQRRRGRRAAVAAAVEARTATAGAGTRTPGSGRRAGGRGRARGARSARGRAGRRRRSEPAPPCFHSRCGAAGRGGGGGLWGAGGNPASPPPPSRAGPSGLHGPQSLCRLRDARRDLCAALAPSALSARPRTGAQIAAAANLPAPPSRLPPSLSPGPARPRAPPPRPRARPCLRAPRPRAAPSLPCWPARPSGARARASCAPLAAGAPGVIPYLHALDSVLHSAVPAGRVHRPAAQGRRIRGPSGGSTFNRLKAWSHRFNGGMAGFSRDQRTGHRC